MTSRPADEARRALREARGRGEAAGADGERGVTSPPSSPSPSSHPAPSPSVPEQEQEGDPGRKPGEPTLSRPGDIARAALRSARTARQAGAHNPADSPDIPPDVHDEPEVSNASDVPPPGSPGAAHPAGWATPADPADPTGSEDPGPVGEPVAPGEKTGRSDDVPAPDGSEGSGGRDGRAGSDGRAVPEGASLPGSVGAGAARPADVAREALRAARRQAKAEASAKSGSAEGGSAEGAAHARRSSRPAGRQRRADGPGTADARARAVRDFAAGAFRLPPEADPVEEVLPAGEPAGGPAAGVRAAAHPEQDSAPVEEVLPAGEPAAATDAEGRAATHPHPEPDPSPGADRAAEATPTSPDADADPAPDPESPEPGAEWARRPRQPSTPRGRAIADATAPPAQPRAPRSMAAPDRDGDLRRTFPALPPRTADEGFAGTWWGNAWVTALEEGALDAARLERGRGYAERGHVDAITVTPGLVLAYVQGSRARPYRVQVRLRTLGDADWDRFLDAAVERPGHIAALLDRELPHSLADLADRGVPLLPGPGDLTPQCSCPDSGHPCKHAAALCYQTARLLDADPFVLLLLRGRGERALLDALSRRNAARAARAAQDRGPAPLPGVRAGEALTPRALPPLPAPLPAPPHPEQPPAYPAAPGGPDPFALDQLATDAAARAHALLTTGRDPVGGLTLWQDAVRLAAARPGSGLTAGTRALYASLASATGRDTAELARAVAAWRQGGPDGLDVLEEPWDPPAGRFDRARPLLLAADLPAFRPWRNRLTHPRAHVQLRLGRTGLWYAYESEPGREDWWPRGTPDLDPVGALTGLGTRVDL
ncbi:SWIM zinc finger family protein [Streptomyces sp. NPDC020571]|uniref:SWIM zinc finger family protein n=1 Tax=Streptomyces sp. NPDC020571 TaxID=3365079 RepID=UPI0037B4CDEC